MIALAPIGREFRAASRQKRLYTMRTATGLVLGFGLLLGVMLSGMSPGSGGAMAFAIMAMIVFLLTSLSVVSQSCGAISDEQRNGTLGLLLLTPLRPLDVVMGKFS